MKIKQPEQLRLGIERRLADGWSALLIANDMATRVNHYLLPKGSESRIHLPARQRFLDLLRDGLTTRRGEPIVTDSLLDALVHVVNTTTMVPNPPSENTNYVVIEDLNSVYWIDGKGSFCTCPE